MFCNECGAPNPDGAKFCNDCGKSLTAPTPPPSHAEPDIVKRQFPIDSEVPTLASISTRSNPTGNFQPTISESDSSSGMGKYLGIVLLIIIVIAIVALVSKNSGDSNTSAAKQEEPPRANVTIHPYDLVKNPFQYKNMLVVLNVVERPVVSNGAIFEYLNVVGDLNSGANPVATQLGLMGLRLNRMTSEDTALYDVMGVNTDSYASGDAVVLGQIAIILPAQQSELELLRGWEVEPLGTVDGTNAFGGHLQVPLVRFWRYASVSVALTSNPDGAQIYVNDSLVGNAPLTLSLSPGKHIIRVSLSGYKDWVREVSAESGAKTELAANLEKDN
jgi:hypothetical protein